MKLTKSSNVLIRRALRLSGFMILLMLAASADLGRAQQEETPKGDEQTVNWALLIGAGIYEQPHLRLEHTESDLLQLKNVLTHRGNYDEQNNVKYLYDKRRIELLSDLEDFLTPATGGPDEDDQLLLYFTGHGFSVTTEIGEELLSDLALRSLFNIHSLGHFASELMEDGLYLAPVDFDSDDPTGTGIDVRVLRQLLGKCRAKTKFLIIDSCFAGSKGVEATEIEDRFDGLDGVVTLASSTADEVSLVWSERKHSLFTYWLIQALKGHADSSLDGKVTFEEVYRFVHKMVFDTARTLGETQTPVASVRFSNKGFPIVTELTPMENITEVLFDMAQQTVVATETQKLRKIISVPPFVYTSYRDIHDLDYKKLPGGEGWIGSDYSNQFRDMLRITKEYQKSDVDIQSLAQAQRLLKKINAMPRDLFTTSGTKRITRPSGENPSDVVVYGEILQREPWILQLRARAIRTDNMETLIETGGVVELDRMAYIEANHSFVNQAGDSKQVSDRKTLLSSKGAAAILQWHEREKNSLHPLQEDSFPFRLNVKVPSRIKAGEWVVRSPAFIGARDDGKNAQPFVALEKGEKYRINVEYRDGAANYGKVFMMLLVDGLDIMDQKPKLGVPANIVKTKGWEALDQTPANLAGNFAALTNIAEGGKIQKSKLWIVRPGSSQTYEGFYENDFSVCPFIVCDASESRGLADQIGVITAIFFKEIERRGDVGTTPGEVQEAEKPIARTPAGTVGPLIGAVHLHYVSHNELERLKAGG